MKEGLQVKVYRSEFGWYAKADDASHVHGANQYDALEKWHKKHGKDYGLQVPAKEITVILPFAEEDKQT